MILRRTRARMKLAAKLKMFDWFGLQTAIDDRQHRILEKHMGFPGQLASHTKFQIDFLVNNGLTPEHRFLEIGCGPLTAGLPVIRYLNNGNYTGVDIRGEVLNLAWQEVGRAQLAGKNPRLILAEDFGQGELAGHLFDRIVSFSVLYHLTDELLQEWFAAVSKSLLRTGKAFANVNTVSSESHWLQFPFVRRSITDYERGAAKYGLKVRSLGTLSELSLPGEFEDSQNPMLLITHA